MTDDDLVTVCDHCLQASCWQGHSYCDAALAAGTAEMTIAQLRAMGLESSDYWKKAAG